jgi:hypothetical protein
MKHGVAWRLSPALISALGLVVAAACSGGDRQPATPTPGETAAAAVSPTLQPPVPCPIPEQDVCEFAVQLEKKVQANDFSSLGPDVAAFSDIIRRGLEGHAPLLVSIGCPKAAVSIGCGGTFGLGFTTLTPGADPGDADSGLLAIAFWRDPACDFKVIYDTGKMPACTAQEPKFISAVAVGSRDFRRTVLNGGIAQGGTLAGRPLGITDTTVRSDWVPFFAEPRPSPTPPLTIGGVPVRELSLVAQGRPIPFSGVMLLQSGCWGCDGPTSALARVYYGPAGKLRSEQLPSPVTGKEVYFTGVLVRPDTNEIVAAMCVTGYCGALNAVTTDSHSKVFRSRDGGITWQEFVDFPGSAYLGALTPDGFIVQRGFGPGDPREWEYNDYYWPSGEKIAVPAGAKPYNLTMFGDVVTYRSDDGKSFLKPDGSVYWTFPLSEPVDEYGVGVQSDATGESLVVTWGTTPGGPGAGKRQGYVGLFRGGTLRSVFRSNDYFGGGGRVWLGNNAVAGNAGLTNYQLGIDPGGNLSSFQRSVPVAIDYAAGTVAPIEPAFIDANYRTNRAYVTALFPGPVVKVAGAGDCLNVRENASTAAPILACYHDGVLLQKIGEPVAGDGGQWLPVATPDGRKGFASTQYLER